MHVRCGRFSSRNLHDYEIENETHVFVRLKEQHEENCLIYIEANRSEWIRF